MKFSYSITNTEIDSYRIEISNMTLPVELKRKLTPDIELCDIILLREKGTYYTPIKVLYKIAEKIANFFISNPNVMLFFMCDDMTPIPYTKKQILPQEYRDRLFKSMFHVYKRRKRIKNIKDYPICINDAYGNPMYMHIYAKEENEKDVMIIFNDLIDNYSK